MIPLNLTAAAMHSRLLGSVKRQPKNSGKSGSRSIHRKQASTYMREYYYTQFAEFGAMKIESCAASVCSGSDRFRRHAAPAAALGRRMGPPSVPVFFVPLLWRVRGSVGFRSIPAAKTEAVNPINKVGGKSRYTKITNGGKKEGGGQNEAKENSEDGIASQTERCGIFQGCCLPKRIQCPHVVVVKWHHMSCGSEYEVNISKSRGRGGAVKSKQCMDFARGYNAVRDQL